MKRFACLTLLLAAGSAWGQTITYPAGAYTVTTPGPTTITQTETSVTISWGPSPVPVPMPPTPPGPAPIPASTRLFAIALFDDASAKPTPAQTALRSSATIRALLQAMNVGWAAGDVTAPTLTEWAPAARAVPKPALVLMTVDAQGHGVLLPGYPEPLPADEAAVVSLIKSVRGVN